ncbi:MAG: calcium-translocating P-type ATPase, SERCA-type [Thermanaeromonas sp.]|uniref:calcium-translocating P-type ATPase, SERCA-type n=1 Tax=Thermanaeromonas sp. TaxID=2003697 RepID=UPI00243D8EFC|nr:calcium-translocating P-type ATPase, SERCA-type [Thermanaeromonas sp.]MCG0276946.1 calcium-translocating P-type ATPase, SERCA-type [Thermanaeromonas sp.]
MHLSVKWYQMDGGQALKELKSDAERGLTSQEARRRLQEKGFNLLNEQGQVSPFQIFLQQFNDFMVWVLLAATAISAFLGEVADAITIVAIVIINGFLGFIQEYRAERSMKVLKEMSAPFARVIRDGEPQRVPAREVVPGDILLVEAGDRVAADALLLWSSALEVEEAALTGESLPVVKEPGALKGEVPLGDRKNMLFQGTLVTRGRGKALVVATGMDTEIGKIAGMLLEVEDEDTPLKKRLAGLGKWLVGICLFICGLMVVAGAARGENLYNMFLAGVSLAVAAIPEGLPAIVTVCLALGVQRMAKRQAIIRKLAAVEALGCATVICSDKTGTLTQNQMTVRELWVDNKVYQVTGTGYIPQGAFYVEGRKAEVDEALKALLTAAALCNNATLKRNGLTIKGWLRGRKGSPVWSINGDPTEGALLVAAAKAGIWREHLERAAQRLQEFPFEPERKRMSVVYQRNGRRWAYVKGAPDVVLGLCNSVYHKGKKVPLTAERAQAIERQNEDMARRAFRVLALAFRELPSGVSSAEEVERDLTFLGLAGMIDPPRPEAQEAVRICQRAGIKVVMITGDHRLTAQAVAQELGLPAGDDQILTGSQLDSLSDQELIRAVKDVSVYARVSPVHKLRIVRALKANSHVVAMTGDGVNDAPAIKEADIGIAMGRTGTDVAKESAAMILADDNFATIVAAVEEGRAIYTNIRKFIRYLLSCNVGEVLTMFVAALAGLPLPLLPIQILWMNLVTDGLPALALSLDPPEPGLMSRPPYPPGESIFARGLGWRILSLGMEIGLVTLGVFLLGLFLGEGDLPTARTMAFTSLVMAQLFAVFECRSETQSPFAVGYFSNRYLVLAVACSLAMQLLVLYVPLLQAVFDTVPLNPFQWLLVLLASGWRTYLAGIGYYLIRPIWRILLEKPSALG